MISGAPPNSSEYHRCQQQEDDFAQICRGIEALKLLEAGVTEIVPELETGVKERSRNVVCMG
jgi:hypothetical protein